MHSDTTAATRRPRIISGRSLLDSRTVDVVCRETAILVGIAREVNCSLGEVCKSSRNGGRAHFRSTSLRSADLRIATTGGVSQAAGARRDNCGDKCASGRGGVERASREVCDGQEVGGGEGQNRTVDTTIFSRMLYQLSYLATGGITTIGELAAS